MPRTKTGPRPYECVRRAWHSDRHQPIRGSLIKEIFRVANEIHSSSTKQNKEWQEKLPTVVLKAEEIIYSKANSEAEYMDLKTLWDRTNDAINTIIRRDEGSETGEFLQPCIEAALNLGCTPRRASRSQRNCHPRCYLSSNSAGDVDQSVVTNCPNLLRPPKHFGAYPRTTLLAQTSVAAAAPNNAPLSNFVAPDSFAAYPLYYGHVPRFEPIHQGFVLLPKPSVSDAKGHVVPKPQCREDYAVKKIAECKDINLASDPLKIGCDLSLRLAPLSVSVPTPSRHDVSEDILKRRGEFCHRLPVLDKEASFFPQGNTGRGSLFKSAEAEATVRKRKAGFDDQPTAREDRRFCLQPKLPFRHLT